MNLSEYQVIPVLEGLKELQTIAQTNPQELNNVYGICYHLNKICSNSKLNCEYVFVEKLSEGWERHSGCAIYPVPDNDDYGCWEGSNLTLRLELIEYLIRQIESCEDNVMFGLCLKEMVK